MYTQSWTMRVFYIEKWERYSVWNATIPKVKLKSIGICFKIGSVFEIFYFLFSFFFFQVTFLMMPLEIVWAMTVSWWAGDFVCRMCSFFRIFGLFLSSNVVVCISVDRWVLCLPLSDLLFCGYFSVIIEVIFGVDLEFYFSSLLQSWWNSEKKNTRRTKNSKRVRPMSKCPCYVLGAIWWNEMLDVKMTRQKMACFVSNNFHFAFTLSNSIKDYFILYGNSNENR